MNKLRQIAPSLLLGAPAATAVAGAIIYFVYGLNTTGAWLAIILTVFFLSLLAFLVIKEPAIKRGAYSVSFSRYELVVAACFIIAWILSFYFLYSARSYRAIITPWQVVSVWYFVTYAIGVLCLMLFGRVSSKLLPAALTLQSLLLFGTALIVYQIGYGFDPFIHNAAVQAIMKLGRIIPLTPYYLGQYGLVICLHHLFGIGASVIAKLLVPGLATLFLPALIWRWLRRHHGSEKDWGLAALFLLLLPVTLFIVTTPQSLSFLFLLIALLWPSPRPTRSELYIVWLCALAAAVTQPIAGIPALLLAIFDSIRGSRWEKKIYPLLLIGFALGIPAAFYLFSYLNTGAAVSLTWPDLTSLFSWLIPKVPGSEGWLINFVYVFNGLRGLGLIAIAILGAFIVWRRHSPELCRRFAWPAIALLIGALVTACLNFHFLIDYEKSDYSERLLTASLLFSVPLLLTVGRLVAQKIEQSGRYIFISILVLTVAASTASLYLSYPRFDDYINSHGYATSRADILAVNWIEQDSAGRPYVVLANQQTSAAALSQFGFKKYYNNIFYYPIPTGGDLYKEYLSIVDAPSLSIIKKTRQLTGVHQVYVVINSYWWKAKDLETQLGSIADKIQDIGSGQAKIYVFSR